jgi:hypothetical protein
LAKQSLKKIKLIAFLFLITSIMMPFSFLRSVKAQTKVISVTPTSATVGTLVNLKANVSTPGDQYNVKFDNNVVATRNATGFDVNTTFNIPDAIAGNHTISIISLATNETAGTTFTVLTSYSMNVTTPASPGQMQEGDSVPISFNVTGGYRSDTFSANMTIQTPNNATFEKYEKILNVSTSYTGNASITMTYPYDFSPNANTSLVGEYEIYFNTTAANTKFTIGLTNSTEYHRGQTVDVKALYLPTENMSISILGDNVNFFDNSSDNLRADGNGVIHYTNWTVPYSASMGSYMVNMTSISNLTRKLPLDIQNFTVPGYAINITTRNLAWAPVYNVTLRVFENAVSIANGTSNLNGLVEQLRLESGNYTGEAYFKDHKVGEDWINITGSTSLDFRCNLTSLGINVTDETGIPIPDIGLNLTSDNNTLMALSTSISGIAVASSLLPDQNYTLNASRYDMQFNTTTVLQLPTTDWINITIICPTMTLQITVTSATGQAINNATVKAREVSGGFISQGNTVNGILALNGIFGRYLIQVYMYGIKLNETTVDLNQTVVNVTVVCDSYGLSISIKIVDYFGQPISGANVTLKQGSWQDFHLTESDGIVSFTNTIGGNMQAVVYLPGQTEPYTMRTFSFDNSTTQPLEIKADKFMLLAGFLVETGQVATTMLVVAIVVLILSLELYRRRRANSQKSES